jgi:hypothetical protein
MQRLHLGSGVEDINTGSKIKRKTWLCVVIITISGYAVSFTK